MKRVAVWLLLATVSPGFANAADPAILPTVPQVPSPNLPQEPKVVYATGVVDRVFGPLRERLGMTSPAKQSSDAPVAPSEPANCTADAAGVRSCGASIVPGSPIKSWLCFRPTTGHALPWLQPQEYVGPITGQFRCTSAGCASCGDKPGCATNGAGSAKMIGGHRIGGRGCANGTCVLPPDDAFGGYRFATPESPKVTGISPPPATSNYASNKPTVAPAGTPAQAAPRTTVLESLKRTFSRQ